MESANAQTKHIMPSNKASSVRNVLHLVESLAKMVLWNSQNFTGYWSFPTDSKTLLLKKTLFMFLKMQKTSWCLTRNYIPTDWCLWCWKFLYALPDQKGNHQYRPATDPATHNSDLPANILVQQWHQYHESNQPNHFLIGCKVDSMIQSPYLTLLKIGHGLKVELKLLYC